MCVYSYTVCIHDSTSCLIMLTDANASALYSGGKIGGTFGKCNLHFSGEGGGGNM